MFENEIILLIVAPLKQLSLQSRLGEDFPSLIFWGRRTEARNYLLNSMIITSSIGSMEITLFGVYKIRKTGRVLEPNRNSYYDLHESYRLQVGGHGDVLVFLLFFFSFSSTKIVKEGTYAVFFVSLQFLEFHEKYIWRHMGVIRRSC